MLHTLNTKFTERIYQLFYLSWENINQPPNYMKSHFKKVKLKL